MKNKLLYCFILLLLFLLLLAQAAIADENATNAIQNAEKEIQQMRDDGFSANSANDSLFLAKQALQKGSTYAEISQHTSKALQIKKQAYLLSDSIRAAELKKEKYKKDLVNVTEAEKLLVSAKESLAKEQYSETEKLLTDINIELDAKKAEQTMIKLLFKSGRGFLTKNWKWLTTFIIILLALIILLLKKIKTKQLKNRLQKLTAEQEALIELMKKTQIARFEQGKIPESIYNIRMEKYTKRLNQLKETIPVVENELKKKTYITKSSAKLT